MKFVKDGARYRDADAAEDEKALTFYQRRKGLGFEVLEPKFSATTRFVIEPEDADLKTPFDRDGQRITLGGKLRHGWKRSLGFISEEGTRPYEGELILEVHVSEETKGYFSHHRATEGHPEVVFLELNMPSERFEWLRTRWLERPDQVLGLKVELPMFQEATEGLFAEFDQYQFLYIEPQKPGEYDGGRTRLSAFEFTLQEREKQPVAELPVLPREEPAPAAPQKPATRRIETLLTTIAALLLLLLLAQCT